MRYLFFIYMKMIDQINISVKCKYLINNSV